MEKCYIECLCEMVFEMCGKVMLFGYWDNECEIFDLYCKSWEMFVVVYILFEWFVC